MSDQGIRVTEQRLTILRELMRQKSPASHPELTARLAGAGLDRATVYRNLHSLAKAGLVVKTHLGDSVWRFELPSMKSAAHDRHPHFVCNECGDVACLPESTIALRDEAVRHRVDEVQLRGRCVDCARSR